MKPLIVLSTVFMITLLATKMYSGNFQLAFSGKLAMSVMLVFTAIAHFAFTQGMAMMLPDFIPNRTAIIYLTGIIEIVFAIGLFVPGFTVITGWLLLVFFMLMLPANIYASILKVNYEKGTFNGNGIGYLWFRIPLQILFMVWVYLSAIKS